MKRSKSSRILKILSYVLLITGMIVILYPFYLTIITALKTPQESSQSFFSFPQSFYLGNFVNVLQKANYFVFFRNSAVVTLVSVFLIMVLIPMCSYAIARNMEKRYYKTMYFYLLAGIFVPFQVIMVPLVKYLAKLKLCNIPGLIIMCVTLASSQGVFLLVNYIRSVPRDLEEAAYIDGCGTVKAYVKIVLPMIKPILATIFVLNALWVWNDFQMPLLILNQSQDMWTLPLFQYNFKSQYSFDYNLAFASYLIAMIPVLIAYVMLLSGIECMDNELIVQEKVESMLSYFCTCKHMNITMGVGLVYSSKEKIYQSYNEALYALNQRLIQGWNRAYFYKNMDGYKARIGKEAEIKLESIVRTRKEKEINQVIHSILEDIIIKEESAQKLYMAVVEILKILGNYYAELYQDEDIEELKDIKVMFSRRYDLYKFKHIEELENYLKEMVIVICSGKENTKKKSKIVEEIVHYVENNYYKNISLRELAENKYFVNYSYCSRLFSQETGMNFSKYLIQYRLKKAKTLLENKDMKISFIAFEVGYNDVSHFIQSFKKSYGLTPEEYRARKKIE